MPAVICAGCGRSFEGKRKTAKYCGDRCRKRGNRRGKADAKPESKATETETGDQVFSGGLVAKVRAELEQHARLDTIAGQQALLLAERMTSPFESGSGVAALSKQLDVAVAAALEGVGTAGDELDEIAAKRAEKTRQAQHG